MKVIAIANPPCRKGDLGFTLIELLVTLLISMIITAAVYSAYRGQQRSQLAQNQVVEVQENIRSLTTFLASEIRLAGYGADSATENGISTATASRFGIKWDKDGDNSVSGDNEYFEYGFRPADDPDDDGLIEDGDVASFCRRRTNMNDTAAGFEELTDNINAIEFLYILEDDNDNGSYDPQTTLTPDNLDDIRGIRISILARAAREDPDFVNNMAYTTGSGNIWGPFNDHYRRRMLTTTVNLRNMGL